MAKGFYLFPNSSQRGKVKEIYLYPTASTRGRVTNGYLFDAAGQRQQFFSRSGGVAAASFTFSANGGFYDQGEGSLAGSGWGNYISWPSDSVATPTIPPSPTGVGVCNYLLCSNGNSGDVGLPFGKLIYEIAGTGPGVLQNAFTNLQIPGFDNVNFPSAAAVFQQFVNGATWTWTLGSLSTDLYGGGQAIFT